jgi:hypothetical protein
MRIDIPKIVASLATHFLADESDYESSSKSLLPRFSDCIRFSSFSLATYLPRKEEKH